MSSSDRLMSKRTISFQLPIPLLDKIDQIALAKHHKRSSVIRDILRDHVEFARSSSYVAHEPDAVSTISQAKEAQS